MGFPNVSTFASAADAGQEWMSFFHKNGSPILPAGGWCSDLSMAAGTPKYNAYVGAQGEGTPFVGGGNFGIYVPGIPADKTLHISEINIGTPGGTLAPATFYLCDYLYVYALTDMDDTSAQVMDNGIAPVPRYADGLGVQAMVVTTTPQTAVAQCSISYTNSAGVSGRTSSIYTAISNTGNIQGAQQAAGGAGSMSPFIPLASGDLGIRTIDSVTMLASGGGFTAVVLVRPIAEIKLREQNTVAEINYLVSKRQLPKVLAGAYLNWVYSSGVAAASSVIRGYIKFNWN
jgi:hypothetical protein